MIADAPLLDLMYLARNLRARDRQELEVTRPNMDPGLLALDAYRSRWRKAAYLPGGEPALAIGVKLLSPSEAIVWGFGTPSYRSVARSVTEYVKGSMIPEIIETGVRRARCLVHPDNRASQRWLNSIGFRCATTCRIGSADMQIFAYTANDDTDSTPH